MRRLPALAVLLIAGAWSAATHAGASGSKDFQPDPRSVQRYGPAYRYPQAGWIVVHIEGEPYERGVQHGRLLAPEIAAHIRCFAATQSSKSPSDGWKQTRTLCNALFLRRYEKEYLEEMKGIADGATAAGAKFDDRSIDLLDIVALNAWPELDTLDSALEATAHGLEGVKFPRPLGRPAADKPMRCSAFAAVGPATADGKIVFGHITMFSLYPSSFYNIWLDVKGSKGHRVLMQTYPGGIQSGLDYYMNDAGLLISETTLSQTRFNVKGMTLASRIRQAIQYADSIDKAVEILKAANNGLYTNEWLLADIKTNEIAMFELGTHKTRLWRSSKNEWFGGTEGFYWGCNNTKDLDVRLETLPSLEDRPGRGVFRPSNRDQMWLKLYDKYKGKIDVEFGKLAFTTAPLAAFHSVDAKFTTTAMAGSLKTWALFGPPLGRTWEPTFDERKSYPEVQPLVGNPWTVLHADPPAPARSGEAVALDLHDPEKGGDKLPEAAKGDPETVPAWRGTLLPKNDPDVWLAAAFTTYERYVALENALRNRSDGKLTDADRDRLALKLFESRTEYELGARARKETPLSETAADLRQDDWFRVAEGKGVLLLHTLRDRLGGDNFDEMMDTFGRENAGKTVAVAAFKAVAEKAAGKSLEDFFEEWLNKTGLPEGAAKGGPFNVLTFFSELEETLIVYGTGDEANVNREAAELLQKALLRKGPNILVAVKSDRDVGDEELRSRHLLLIGRPDANRLTERFRAALPLSLGWRSFTVNGECYAHADSAVIAAAENPANKRYSIVAIAGLNAAATRRAAPWLADSADRGEVVVLPHNASARTLVVTPKTGEAKPQKKGK
jgi:hypothetical protein